MIHSVRLFINNRLVGNFGEKFLKGIKNTDTLQILLNKIKSYVPNNIIGYERIKQFDYSYIPKDAKLPVGIFGVKVGTIQRQDFSHEISCTSNTTLLSLFSRFKGFVLDTNKDKLIVCIPVECKNWD